MQSHSEISETFENNDIKSKPTIMELLFKLEQIIFNLTQDNFELTIDQTMKLFDLDFPYSYNKIISNLVYFAFYSNNELNIYLNYLETIQIKEKEIQKNVTNITKIFSNHISKIGSQESYYLLEEMIRRNLIDSNITKNIRSFYFMHYKVNPDIYAKFYISPHEAFFTYEELSKNDFELHKQLIKKGVNPNEIAKIIRNDEIEKLQEISSQNDFDFNQTIPKSVYERCSFINQRNVTLIDYAAFFSSIKCFKYLLMNGASVGNTGKYAIASGNVEIFHLCEQNHSSFEESYETAIQFHQNDVFKYVYENKLEQIYENAQYLIRKFSSKGHSCPVNINDLGCLCIKTGNYEIFSFLQGVGLKINDSIIDEAAKVGNLYLVKYFLQNNQTPKDIFIFSSESGNIELVKYVFELKEININAMYNAYFNVLFTNDIWKLYKLLETAFLKASENGHIEIVKFLLEQKGIDIKARGKYAQTPLILASLNGHIEIVKLLLEQKGIDINNKDDWRKTALMYASENGHIDIVKLLLEQEGIDINAKDKRGQTALMKASENGHTGTVKLINERKVNTNTFDFSVLTNKNNFLLLNGFQNNFKFKEDTHKNSNNKNISGSKHIDISTQTNNIEINSRKTSSKSLHYQNVIHINLQ